jgi:hypothetical protein
MTGVRSLSALLLLFVDVSACALSVTAPPAGSTIVQAGDDFATQVIGDAWDMSNPQDIDTDESANLTSQTFSGGVFSASASACTASFWPQFTGYGSQIVAIERGPRYPIDTSIYRYFTIKFKTSTAQSDRVLFFKNGDTGVTGNYGSGIFKSSPANQWTIQSWDLYSDVYTTSPYFPWTSFAQVQGIRFDPCSTGTPSIQVDWVRLTAVPTGSQMYTVTWSDSGGSGPYTVTAIDADSATYTFTSSASGTSYAADLSRLEPGDYHIQVSRSGASATSTGVLHVNTPPQVQINAPTQRGEQALSYAIQEQGGQWGPMSAADFKSVVNFKNVSYTNPAGSFSGRPTNNDPEFIMQTSGHTIDASYYRSACFTLEVFGTRSVGSGGVARLFWGVNSSGVSTTTDIILDSGLVEYCLPDLADASAVLLVAGSPQPWAGSLGYFRLDPDEYTPPTGCSTPQTCHDVRLDSIILAPFAEANPSYLVQWNITDPDYSGGGSIEILLDPDKTFGNGNEILLTTLPFSTGAGQYDFVDVASAPDGTYNLVVFANDGKNAVPQYAGGLIIIRSDVIFRDGFESP